MNSNILFSEISGAFASEPNRGPNRLHADVRSLRLFGSDSITPFVVNADEDDKWGFIRRTCPAHAGTSVYILGSQMAYELLGACPFFNLKLVPQVRNCFFL